MTTFGILAMIMSLILTTIGLPHQIYKIYKKKSCEGVSFVLSLTVFSAYTSWGLYGWTKPDIFLMISQTPGSALSLLLLTQFFYYRKT
ncbi:MAG: hypothetical protein HYT22_02215 [Candidatus Niyogibacteria bacterium]|nr:hypothetical protein [Candidatus Niyogibacteria bacterium]